MEDSELKELLLRNLKLAEENNKLLLGMRRSARWSAFFRVIYWFVILGGLAFSYYFIQPYLTAALNAYDQIQGSVDEIKRQQNSLPNFRALIDKLGQEVR